MIEIFKEFNFDAAHYLAANVAVDHPYARIHGHSFTVQVVLRGEPDPKTGWLVDFAEFEKSLNGVHAQIDHRTLNDVKGLEHPTLENIARWVWQQVKPSLPHLHRVTVHRGTLGEGCTYWE